MSSSIAAHGEHALIRRLRARVGPPPASVTLGIGDDAAVLPPARGMQFVLTTDCLVEGVHFRRDWTPARAIGHKALAVNLSDLGAMGATPRASLLTLCLPDAFPLADFDAVIDGFAALAAHSGATLVGGNLSRSPGPVMIDVTAVGDVRPRRVLRRDGARRGDELYVTGLLGAAAAGLAMAEAGLSREELDADAAACLRRYEAPDARYRCGRIVARVGAASAAVDLSDGLADGARCIAEASGLGVVIEAASVPIHPGAADWARRAGREAMSLAVNGGDDYELLFAVPPRRRSRFLAAIRRCPDVAIARVGRLVAEPGAWIEQAGVREILAPGFGHFAAEMAVP